MFAPTSLLTIPLELLEEIAFTATIMGSEGQDPPMRSLAALAQVDRRTYTRLSINHNKSLYAKLFRHFFDIGPLKRRLGPLVSNEWQAGELRLRFQRMSRMRRMIGATTSSKSVPVVLDLLTFCYSMLLENEGKNDQILLEYGWLDRWIDMYWFAANGYSGAVADVSRDEWPRSDLCNTFAMWVLWLVMRTNLFMTDDSKAIDIVKIYALGAHKYSPTLLRWGSFDATVEYTRNTSPAYLGVDLSPPPLMTAAILVFLAIVNRLAKSPGYNQLYETPVGPTLPKFDPTEWDADWTRSVDRPLSLDVSIADVYRPGSVEGVWQGLFTYTEFTNYARLLAGAPPPTLLQSIVIRHRQTWKLREYHLQIPSDDTARLSARAPVGTSLRSYLPRTVKTQEDDTGLTMTDASDRVYRYKRSTHIDKTLPLDSICDIIIIGDGHSSWGEFNLVGRIRPWDGFISLSKEYVEDGRGTWLYRGYLVGGGRGNFVGRWRDTLSPDHLVGYEGCFTMGRRQ